MRVLHLFYNSLPQISGASIRNRDMVESQGALDDLEPWVITSPIQRPYSKRIERIGGVPYIRTASRNTNLEVKEGGSSLGIQLKKLLSLVVFFVSVGQLAKKIRPEVVHSHSNFYMGIAGDIVSRKLNIPHLYEVRSLWEERTLANKKGLVNRLIYKAVRMGESRALRKADQIVAINENLKTTLVDDRRVPAEKIKVIPNAANLSRIKHAAYRPTLVDKKPEDWVFGYIGTISPIEGLDLLVDSFEELRKKGIKNSVKLYGNGIALDSIKARIEQKGLIDQVQCMGRVSNDEIAEAYSTLDVVVNPRRLSFLTANVTPLKPLEAMGYRKLMLASNIGGMVELIQEKENGLLFKADDQGSLADAIKGILEMPIEELHRIINQGYEHVRVHRSWSKNAKVYQELYKSLLT